MPSNEFFEKNKDLTPRQKFKLSSRWIRNYYVWGTEPPRQGVEVELFGKYGKAAFYACFSPKDYLAEPRRRRTGIDIPF